MSSHSSSVSSGVQVNVLLEAGLGSALDSSLTYVPGEDSVPDQRLEVPSVQNPQFRLLDNFTLWIRAGHSWWAHCCGRVRGRAPFEPRPG